MRISRPLASLTYTLGNNLYIPLTSRSNSLTLPETRGPNFFLPAHVVAALCRVRDVEHGTQQWMHWAMYLDTQVTPQKLPPALEPIAELPPTNGNERLPKVLDLMADVEEAAIIVKENGGKHFDSIVIGGEGESTLRLNDLLELVKSLMDSHQSLPSTRLTTNGLLTTSENAPQKLKESGLSAVSVALMTADPMQYHMIMEPVEAESSHSRVCEFIQQAIKVGLEVETTGVDRKDVDKAKVESLSKSLGVISPVRWRPFFE